MKVLIIGGTSSLGSALKLALAEFSEVITAGRKNCDYYLDLNDSMKNITLPDNINFVIHTASDFGGTAAEKMLVAETINVLGTLKVCNASVQAKAKHFILISSIFSLIKENSVHYSVYSLSKKQSEEIAKLFCSSHSLPLTILRPSQIYGNSDVFRKHQPFLYNLIDKAEKGENITIWGSNDPRKNFIHIEDLTKIIGKVIQNKLEGTFSCSYPEDVSFSQIAKAAFSAFNSQGEIDFIKEKNDVPDNIFEKDNSLYKRIGYYPEISIEEGMKKIAIYRKTHK